jgi:arabinogalactan oligomer/maltooligosaccharide transport system permease protein
MANNNQMKNLTTHEKINLWATRIVLIIITLASLFPTMYVLMISFKAGESLYTSSLIPKQFTIDNYNRLFTQSKFLLWMRNSLIIGVSSALISTLIATLAGYSFSRFRFPGRRYGILILLIVQMLPTSVSLVALFRMLYVMHLLNKLEGLIVVFGLGSGALSVWLMKNYIDTIPKELDESAYIDGANPWQVFWRILFPLIQPMLVAQFILSFIGVYNEYMFSSIVLFDPNLYPLGVGIRTYVTGAYQTNWTAFCASAVIGSFPILIIFFLAQKLLVEGLTRGAIKA